MENRSQEAALTKPSNNSEKCKEISRHLEVILKMSHPDRVHIPDMSQLTTYIAGVASIEVIADGIKNGLMGKYGDVYRIDGVAIIGWINKRIEEDREEEEFRAQMGFGRQNY